MTICWLTRTAHRAIRPQRLARSHRTGDGAAMPPIRLFDSLTRSVREFAPIEPGHARVYSCGPTVYHYAHLGNLRAYVFTDTLTRALRLSGLEVTHIINITDVGHLTSDADAGDDKMETAAAREQKSIWDIAAHYTDAFKADVSALNIREPSRWTVATEHVPQMIEFGQKIADKHCYALPTGLYFDTSTIPDYGRLAGHSTGPIESRIGDVEGKRHASDFAIWRASSPGEQRQMEWDSPWGKGAPGWHLECSAMAQKYLGDYFDIHCGGEDHIPVHHTNEIAQTEARVGTRLANFWMHGYFLVQNDAKMAKSAGEFLRVAALVDRGYDPLAFRYLCLTGHYRTQLNFTWEALDAAATGLARMRTTLHALPSDADAVADADAL